MIWHIVKKDWKLLWVPVIGLGALQITIGALHFLIDSGYSGWVTVIGFLRWVALAGGLLLVAAVVRQDVVPGYRQDWLIRPIPRRDMLLAKAAFLLLMWLGPKFIGDILEAFSNYFPLSQALSIAAERAFLLLVGFGVPWLACMSIYASFAEMVIVSALFSAFTALAARGSNGVLYAIN